MTIDALKLTIEELLAENRRLQEEKASLQEEKASLQEEKASLQEEKTFLQKELSKVEAKLNKKTELFNKSKKELKNKEQEATLYKSEAIDLRFIVNEIESKIIAILKLYAPKSLLTKYEQQENLPAKFMFLAQTLCSNLSVNKQLREYLWGKADNRCPNNDNNSTNDSDETITDEAGKDINPKSDDKKQVASSKFTESALAKNIAKLTQEASRLSSKGAHDEDSLLNALQSRHLPKGVENINRKKNSIGKNKNTNISKNSYTPKTYTTEDIIKSWGSCPNCGSKDASVLKHAAKELLSSLAAIGMLKEDNKTYTVPYEKADVICTNCGFSDLVEFNNIPVLPDRTLSLDVCVFAMLMHVSGLSVNAFNNLFLKEAALGHDTLYSNIRLTANMLSPLVRALEQHIDANQYAIADETVYRIIAKDSPEKKLYIAMKRTLAGQDKQAVYFEPPNKRSIVKPVIARFFDNSLHEQLKGVEDETQIQNIIERSIKKKEHEILASNKTIITDAFTTYSSLVSSYKAKHQTCLAHLYRKLKDYIENINDKSLFEESFKQFSKDLALYLSDKDESKILNKANGALIVLCIIASKVQEIFAIESVAYDKFLSNTNIDKSLIEYRLKYRQKYSLAIKSDIDTLFAKLAKIYTKTTSSGKYTNNGIDPIISSVICYYMNHKESFWTFLDDGNLLCTSNDIEIMAKMIATRRSYLFSRTKEGAEAISKIFTVTASAQINNISNIAAYMLDVLTYVRRQIILNTRLNSFNQRQAKLENDNKNRYNYSELKGIDDIQIPEHLMPWNYVKKQAI